MMTREEIIEIEQYCMEHGVGKKARLAELGIPFWSFYRIGIPEQGRPVIPA